MLLSREVLKKIGLNQLRSLEVHTGLSRDDIPALVSALEDNTSVTEIKMIDCDLDDSAAIALADQLKTIETGVKELILSSNSIGDVGANALLSLDLDFLDLSGNNITDITAQKILQRPANKPVILNGNRQVSPHSLEAIESLFGLNNLSDDEELDQDFKSDVSDDDQAMAQLDNALEIVEQYVTQLPNATREAYKRKFESAFQQQSSPHPTSTFAV